MTIKRFNLFAVFSLSLLLLALLVNVYESRKLQQDIITKEQVRFNSHLLARELIQSSDDLTRMARGYATTGDPAYKDNFLQILAIRNGTAPRPYIDSSTYWHLEGIGKAPANYTGESIALIDLMRRDGELREEELALLEQSKQNSDRLAKIEQQAFAAIEGRFVNDSDEYIATGKPNLELAQKLLWGEEYINEKAKIMLPARQFIEASDHRTKMQLSSLQAKMEQIIFTEMIILIALFVCLTATLFYVWQRILNPLQILTEKTKVIASGNLSVRCNIAGTIEISELGADFDKMASAVEHAMLSAHASEARLLEAQKIAQLGSWEYNLVDNTLYWSEQVYRIFELDPDSFQPSYEAFLNAIHPDDRDKVNQTFHDSVVNREYYEITHRLQLPNGFKWVNECGHTHYDDQGKPVRSIGTIQDITIQAQLKLQLDEQVFQLQERIKELNCLNQLADLGSDTTLSQKVFFNHLVQLIPSGWHEPDLISACIEFDSDRYQSGICNKNSHKMSLPLTLHGIQRGQIEIFHASQLNGPDPFLQEEYRLLNTIAQHTQQILLRKEAEQKVTLYASAFRYSGEAIIIADADRKVIAANRSFYQLTGHSENKILSSNAQALLSEYFTAAIDKRNLWRTLLQNDFWRGEVNIPRQDGKICTALLTVSLIRNNQKQILNYIANFSDITDFKEASDKINYLAHHDSLTGLSNRFACIERFEHAINAAQRNQEKVAIMFIDLDRFKLINDTLGHDIGDLLLKQVAQRLKNSVRNSDIVARLGGDEFVVILPEQKNTETLYPIADKILRSLGQPYQLGTHQLYSSPSIGIAFFPDNGENVQEIMKCADIAMYHAKSKGRNNYQFFTPSMNQTNLERLALEHDMHIALMQEQFVLHYQPKIDTGTQWVVGVEALVRWQHPVKGLISPATFIPLAEESGLIMPLGEWVLRTACRQLSQWHQQNMPGLHMAINLSQIQFRQPNLPAIIASIIRQEGIDPNLLELEITESMAMENPQKTIESMQKLRNIGVRLALDDFGTGYSSMSYLKNFPINSVKLDRTFIENIETDPNDAAICASTITLANSLGLNVVAEGVERKLQYEHLKRLQCHTIQGYYFCKPLPAKEAISFIEHQNAKQSPSQAVARQANILIIDDDDWTCEFHSQLLRNMRHKPVAILNPTEGLDLIRNKPDFFDLVMLDMLMPQMSGVDVVQEICRISPKIPIAVITSFKQEAARKSLLLVEKEFNLLFGINYFILEKPVTVDDIKTMIDKLF